MTPIWPAYRRPDEPPPPPVRPPPERKVGKGKPAPWATRERK